MKRFLSVLAVLMIGISAHAVDLKSGNFGKLIGQSQVNVEFDFGQVLIDGIGFEEFKAMGRVDEDYEKWDDFEIFIKRRFIAGLNEYHTKIPGGIVFRMGGDPCGYTLKVMPVMMNSDGVYNVNFSLIDNNTGKEVASASANGDGGVFGTFSNLQGDGFEELGNDFAKFLVKELRWAMRNQY